MYVRYNKNLMMAASVVVLLNFTSCSKYEDGPGFSLRSKKGRLSGEWEVVKIDGQDQGSTSATFTLEFERDGDFTYSYTYSYPGYSNTYEQDGSWEWENDKESVEIKFSGGSGSLDDMEFDISRLTNDELWFEDESNTEIECEKQ